LKYLTVKTDDIRIRMPKGTKEAWQQMAKASGRSLTQFIKDCVEAAVAENEKEKTGK
jgi:predicted DNA-binding protein